jgi:hypothetical protein
MNHKKPSSHQHGRKKPAHQIIVVTKPQEIRKRTNVHHRKPRCKGGTSSKGNTSKVDRKKHAAFHFLFSDRDGRPLDPIKIAKKIQALHWSVQHFMMDEHGSLKSLHEIVDELNQVWIDPNFQIVTE